MVDHKDVVLALLGASASLAGLLLVFLGFVVSVYSGLSDDHVRRIRDELGRAALALLGAFVVGLSCVGCAAGWLVGLGDDQSLYVAAVVLFFTQLVGLVAATAWTLRQLMGAKRRRTT